MMFWVNGVYVLGPKINLRAELMVQLFSNASPPIRWIQHRMHHLTSSNCIIYDVARICGAVLHNELLHAENEDFYIRMYPTDVSIWQRMLIASLLGWVTQLSDCTEIPKKYGSRRFA